MRHSEMGAAEIAETALKIAVADIDIYTSGTATVLRVPDDDGEDETDTELIEGDAS